MRLIIRLFQDPLIERQPRQLAIDEPLGRRAIDRRHVKRWIFYQVAYGHFSSLPPRRTLPTRGHAVGTKHSRNRTLSANHYNFMTAHLLVSAGDTRQYLAQQRYGHPPLRGQRRRVDRRNQVFGSFERALHARDRKLNNVDANL